MIILWTVGESWPWEAAVCVHCVYRYRQCTGVHRVGARAGAWERASCAWPGLGAWLCLARARWRRPDSPGQSVSWLRGQGTHRVLSPVSGCQSPSHLQTSGSWAEWSVRTREQTQVIHRCDHWYTGQPQRGEHQCLSAVDSVKVTQKNISCCEVPGCCLSIPQPIEFKDKDTLTTIC